MRMSSRNFRGRIAPLFVASGAVLLSLAGGIFAQPPAGGRGGAAAQTAKKQAPEDLTGYWVSIVTEDWRFRMVTPAKGDYASVPINPEGRKVADAWDPDKD